MLSGEASELPPSEAEPDHETEDPDANAAELVRRPPMAPTPHRVFRRRMSVARESRIAEANDDLDGVVFGEEAEKSRAGESQRATAGCACASGVRGSGSRPRPRPGELTPPLTAETRSLKEKRSEGFLAEPFRLPASEHSP